MSNKNRNKNRSRNRPDRRRDETKGGSTSFIPFLIVGIVIVVVVVGAYFIFLADDGDGDDNDNDVNTGGNTNNNNGGNTGGGNEIPAEWWTTYPSKYDEFGTLPDHPGWIKEGFGSKNMMVVFIHSACCAPCVQQENDLKAVLPSYGDQVAYLDLLTENEEDLEQAIEGSQIYYDPASPQSTPHTIILKKVGPTIYWYSYVGALGQDVIIDQLDDGLS